jgi:hypothetical protein
MMIIQLLNKYKIKRSMGYDLIVDAADPFSRTTRPAAETLQITKRTIFSDLVVYSNCHYYRDVLWICLEYIMMALATPVVLLRGKHFQQCL